MLVILIGEEEAVAVACCGSGGSKGVKKFVVTFVSLLLEIMINENQQNFNLQWLVQLGGWSRWQSVVCWR